MGSAGMRDVRNEHFDGQTAGTKQRVMQNYFKEGFVYGSKCREYVLCEGNSMAWPWGTGK